jgi:outer membrane protein assembly factor BamD
MRLHPHGTVRGRRDGKASSSWLALVCAALLGLGALGLSGCSSDEESQLAFEDEPVGKLYNEALDLLAEEDYKAAAAKFEDVERQHPYSDWARKAIVMSAFAYYQGRNYDQAIESAKRYIALHPGGSDAAYAQFLIAESHYEQIPDVTRDQQRTESALEALREIVRRYPETDYARDARRKLREAYDQLAGKEMEVGRYYLRQRNYVAALNRFKIVVKNYQTSSQVEEALMRLTEVYMAMGVASEAQTATAILGHNYPTSPWYQDAYALLQSGGLQPREDKGSWLSSVWKLAAGA